ELLEQDHGQQARASPAARGHMERRRRLADLLAVPAGELLADVLDDLPLPRDHLHGLADILAQLAQPFTAAPGARGRSGHYPPQPAPPGRPRRPAPGAGSRYRTGDRPASWRK